MTLPIHILLVEDNPGDVRLTKEALRDAKMINELHTVADGMEALAFLRREPPHASAPRPDLILLDLNLPKLDGRGVLSFVKSSSELRSIPVVILTSSDAEEDVARSYDLHANCYVRKPVELQSFLDVIQAIDDFWVSVVRLPRRSNV